MVEPYFLSSLEICGFRAFLEPKKFDFSGRRCLAIFAPNGMGKSSVIDALEFMLSGEGTLKRLGKRGVHNQAGPLALVHNFAEERGADARISIGIQSGKNITEGSRSVVGTRQPMPNVARVLNSEFKVEPVIRGHALRAFVEKQTTEERYEEMAKWLQLGSLVEEQKNFRSLRGQIKKETERNDALQSLNNRLAKETAQMVNGWDEAAIVEYVNTSVLAPLDPALRLVSLKMGDPACVEVENRAKAEENRIGLVGLRQIQRAAAALRVEETGAGGAETATIQGGIPVFHGAVATFLAAERKEAEERGKAANAAFQTLWKAAEPFFAEGAEKLATCPICATPIADTEAGSVEAVRNHIGKHLEELGEYAEARKALEDAKTKTAGAQTQLKADLQSLIGLLDEGSQSALKTELSAYQASITEWSGGEAPDSSGISAHISDLLTRLQQSITDIEVRQGEHSYFKVKAKIDRLLEMREEYVFASERREELKKLFESLNAQEVIVSDKIREKIQALLDTLQMPMNDIYKKIQGDDACPIRLELPEEADVNQQRLNLLVDFAPNRIGVQPSGYLSDSQIHSVALALRIAAIKRFNGGAPIIALDDIVTSYDADHRRSVSGFIAELSRDYQILITTHDERFFRYLQDQCEKNMWCFTRILDMDEGRGPRFVDHKVSDEMIEEQWEHGKFAANEMRQAEEEWLLQICRDFGVKIRIRELESPYTYERSELAKALAEFLKRNKLTLPRIEGIANPFLAGLIRGEIENFGSHFRDAPYGDGSIGDEKKRWQEFKEFRGKFVCKKCSRTKFKRPQGMEKPVCAHKNCEAQFEFEELV